MIIDLKLEKSLHLVPSFTGLRCQVKRRSYGNGHLNQSRLALAFPDVQQ